eukprot:m.335830 g.335830  ORF g.335830 m.335830 type:complete len:523 (+) comp17687_c0_seq1:13-1581(+)
MALKTVMLAGCVLSCALLAATQAPGPGPNGLALTPPMGWMSWERFRCQIDCKDYPTQCINEDLYKEMADHIAKDGYLDAGYNQVSIDDCWENKNPMRDPVTKALSPDPERFPSGLKALGDYMHNQGVRFGIYSDEGTLTCGGYPGSKGYEDIDAKTFASWGVDYLKLDGCNNDKQGYVTGYPAMGSALQNSGRNITYSCSWPAYLGGNETAKPFDDMIKAGCNLWRNWDDISNNWNSITSIMDHWGDFGPALKKAAGPGHWNDMDMLLVGDDHYNSTLSPDKARAQMSIWSIMASPLIMGNDLRTVTQEYRDILLNKEVIAVDQDPAGISGLRISPKNDSGEVWARPMHDGSVAVALLIKGAGTSSDTCTWNVTPGKYHDGGPPGNIACVNDGTIQEIREACCGNPDCVEFSTMNDQANAGGQGCLKNKQALTGPVTVDSNYDGWYKAYAPPSGGSNGTVSFNLKDVGLTGTCTVRDLWAQQDMGSATGTYSASVPASGVRLFRLTPSKDNLFSSEFKELWH